MEKFEDPWLSGILDKPVFRVDAGQEDKKPDLPPECFAYSKISVHDIKKGKALTDYGFFIGDTNVTFLCAQAKEASPNPGIIVREAVPGDETAVREIARHAFIYTRFHADPFISRALADEIKSQWAGNYFSGQRGDLMLVAEKKGRLIGFNQVLIKDDMAIIDLIAADKTVQRQGAGKAMIAEMQKRYPKIRVGTQIANNASIALYEKMGFHFESASYVMHYHGSAETK